MDTSIRVEKLAKKYTLGSRQPYRRLTESLTNLLAGPFARLRSGSKDQTPRQDGSFWALKDVSFEVKPGEVVGIIGRNGAGKSTLLKILSRITEPTEGDVWLNGRVGSLLEVGTGFHPELSGRENIYLNGAVLGLKRSDIKRKFDEIVAFSEVDQFLDTPVKRYSSGMYMRLAFAVAAHLEPEILVVDEVLAVGDATFQKKCLGKMNEIANQGRTVLFVSHNLLAVKMLCSKALLLRNGQLEALLPVDQAIQKYLSNQDDASTGQVQWNDPASAPGDHQVKLHAVRVTSASLITSTPPVDVPMRVEIDYWNLETDARRLVSIHLINAMHVTVFTSANFKSASIVPDPWVDQKYPVGLFRTVCEIPPFLLNPGRYTVDIYINSQGATDNIICRRGVIEFEVQDTERFRGDYLGEWFGVVRPLLHWETTQLKDQVGI